MWLSIISAAIVPTFKILFWLFEKKGVSDQTKEDAIEFMKKYLDRENGSVKAKESITAQENLLKKRIQKKKASRS